MQVLIVATSMTPTGVEDEIQCGKHSRIDYLELSRRLEAKYIDCNRVPGNRLAQWLEDTLRLDVRLAFQVAREVGNTRYDVVLSMSERVGIPLAHLLSGRVKHVVQL